MKILSTIVLLLLSITSIAQNLVRDRLNSKKVERRVVMNFTGDLLTPRYSIDDKDYRIDDYGWYNEFNERTTFAIIDQTASLQLRFLNPLRYRVKITTKEIDDPLAQIDTLFNSFQNLAGLITPAADFTKFFTAPTSGKKEEVKKAAASEIAAQTGLPESASVVQTQAESVATKVVATSGTDQMTRVNTIASDPALSASLRGPRGIVNNYTVAKIAVQKDVSEEQLFRSKIGSIKSSSLLEWMMWIQEKNMCFKPDQLINLLTKIGNVEEYIYSKKFEKDIKDDFSSILEKNNVIDFKKSISVTKEHIGRLRTEIKSKKDSLPTLDDAVYYDPVSCTSAFDTYSQARMSGYISYSARILNKRLSVLDGLSDLCDELIKYVQDADENRNTVLVESLKIVNKKISQVTVSVQKVEWETYKGTVSWKFKIKSTKEMSKATFNVVPYASVITEFGVGVLYFFDPLDFPKYELSADKTATGGQTVVQTTSNLVRYLPVPTVTFLPRWGKGDVFWQFQVGATLANNQPVLHAGGGLRLFGFDNSTVKSLSIMGGVAFRFVKAPNSLLGKVATLDELEKDLSTQLKGPTFPYLGIQFNF